MEKQLLEQTVEKFLIIENNVASLGQADALLNANNRLGDGPEFRCAGDYSL